MDKKTLIVRTLSGIVYVALIICAILINDFVFAAIFATLCVLTTYEFHKLTAKQENVNTLAWIGALGSFLLFVGNFLLHLKNDLAFINSKLFYLAIIILAVYVLLIFAVFIIEIFRKKPNPVHNIAYFLLGQIYITVPFVFMFEIFKEFNAVFLLALFVLIWTNDVFAYLIGSLVGKHKLCERISPNKSWEGFFGGLVGALIAGFVFSKIYAENINLIQWLGFAFVVAVFGALGDLFESLIKRTVGVKDSGNIMPGHGGFLDRLDSALFAAPAAMIYLYLILFLK
ncbi:MAG: phosphatidate cytidylyltransferase [Paludibacter sp.]|nr:phosphatidate cytidylyltransferase [Paludibacter sp.]